jgi:hypothetical protein
LSLGRAKECDSEGVETIIDARGIAVAPGLIDSHVDPVAGDWTPRQSLLNWIDSPLRGATMTCGSNESGSPRWSGRANSASQFADPRGFRQRNVCSQSLCPLQISIQSIHLCRLRDDAGVRLTCVQAPA